MLSEDSSRFWAGGGPGGVFTTSVAKRGVPLMFAESVTVVLALTVAVVTGKLALEPPAGTVTLAGTAAAAGLLLDKGTDNPPAGAAFASVTMPCAVSPPRTVGGLTENPSTAGVTVTKPTLLALPPRPSRICAEMVNTVLAATAGGVKTAVVPLPWIDPPSADHWYATASPFKSCATAVKFAVCALLIVSVFAARP